MFTKRQKTFALCAVTTFATTFAAVETTHADKLADLVAEVSAFDLQPVQAPEDRPAHFTIDLPIDGTLRTIQFERVEIWAPDAIVKVYGDDGGFETIDPPESNVYRGFVDGVPGSVVTAGLKSDGLYATIRMPDAPTKSLVPADGTGLHMLFNASDRESPPMLCDQPDDVGRPDDHPAPHPVEQPNAARGIGTSTHVANLGLDCDFEYYDWNGSVESTLNEMMLVVNNINEAYERDVNITHIVTTAIVRTSSNDPYASTDGATINDEQETEWTTNQSHVPYDVVLMFTDKNTCAPAPTGCDLIGRAHTIGAVCDRSKAFCFTEARSSDTTQAQIAAHELGHVWDGRHCNSDQSSGCIGVGQCRLMCNTINGCDQDSDVQFGSCNIGRVIAHRDSIDCLEDGANGQVWVQYRNCGICFEVGTFQYPFNTLGEAASLCPEGGIIMIRSGSSSASGSDETYPLVVNKNIRFQTFNGPATIGE